MTVRTPGPQSPAGGPYARKYAAHLLKRLVTRRATTASRGDCVFRHDSNLLNRQA